MNFKKVITATGIGAAAIAMVSSFAFAAHTVITPSNLAVPDNATTIKNSWYFFNDNTNAASVAEVDGSYKFVAGPGDPPGGEGSIEFKTAAGDRWNIATNQFAGTDLGDLDDLAMTIYKPSTSTGSDDTTLFFHFDIDFDKTTNSSYQGRLVYVPDDNSVPTLTEDTWQTWDMDQGKWKWSRFATNGNQWPDGNTTELRTWSDIVAAFPNAEVYNQAFTGQLLVRAGQPGPAGFVSYLDSVVVGGKTYDFELIAAPTITIPANNATVTTSALTKVDWSDVTGATEYQYEAYSDAGYTSLVFAGGWLSTSEINTPGTPPGEYYVRVRARNANQATSAWSNGSANPYHFTVTANVTVTPTPTVISPNIPAECQNMALTNVINGTANSDYLVGTEGNDLIFAGGGSDYVDGKGGTDCIVGGDGSDYLLGGAGNDTLLGQGGSDAIVGGLGNDKLWGGADSDSLRGDEGDDALDGQAGSDAANGGANSDTCTAEAETQCEI